MFNRKGDGGLIAIIIILLVLIFLGWVVKIGNRECNNNKECSEDYYCGSDFQCHKYPNIQKTISNADYTKPALLIGLAIIIGALILKYFNIRKKDPKEEKITQETKTEEIKEVKPEEKQETKKKEEKKETNYTYYNYPTDSQQYSTKDKNKKAEDKGTKDKLFNNYIGIILGGLAALGIVLVANINFIGIALFGAIILFVVIYKLWGYSIEYNAEIYLISVLSLIYITLSFIYFIKGGIFTLIGISFLIITLFVVKETVGWLGYKSLQ